jgi:hypothetical protein
MSNTYTHKIILFTDSKNGKRDALVVMANTIQDYDVIKDLNCINWANKITSVIVQKGGWELYTKVDSNSGSQGIHRELYDVKCNSCEGLSNVHRIHATLKR